MAIPKNWGSLLIQTPVFNTGGGDFTMVDDPTQQNFPLGGIYIQPDSTYHPRIWKYVQWKPTAPATYTQGAPVYYVDEARTQITNTVTEAKTYIVSSISAVFSFAGLILNPASPAAIGDYVFIQVSGYSSKINMPASTTAGDVLVLSNAANTAPTNNIFVRVAAATDLGSIKSSLGLVIVTTAAASGGGLGSGWLKTPLVLF